MCGIVGYIGNREASPILLEGLKRLEYRGYDSAGIAVLADDTLKLKKHKGRVTDLARNLNSSSVSGSLGISHTRWATHGSVTEANAHPHVSHDGKISLVHNGVIENYLSVKKFLESTGVEFYSETDSEVFCNLIAYHYQKESEASPTRFLDSVRRSLRHIVGTYGGMIKLAVLMALFVQMFRYAWQPFFLQRQKDHDAPELFGKVFAVLTLILTSAYLGISFFAEEIVRFPVPGNRTLIASSYWMGLSIIPVALIGYVFQGWYYHFSAGAYIKNQSKYFLHATAMGSITALVINAWFVPTGGMIAAAAATSAAYAVMAIVLFFLIRPHYPLPYNWVRTIGVILLAGGTFWFWSAQATLQVWWAELGIVIGYALIASTLLGIPVTRVRSLLGQRASSE